MLLHFFFWFYCIKWCEASYFWINFSSIWQFIFVSASIQRKPFMWHTIENFVFISWTKKIFFSLINEPNWKKERITIVLFWNQQYRKMSFLFCSFSMPNQTNCTLFILQHIYNVSFHWNQVAKKIDKKLSKEIYVSHVQWKKRKKI